MQCQICIVSRGEHRLTSLQTAEDFIRRVTIDFSSAQLPPTHTYTRREGLEICQSSLGRLVFTASYRTYAHA